MAIYHLSCKAIGRNQGRSATAAAAYRAAVRIEDARTGMVFDYSRKRGVDGSEILTPDGSNPERGALWNSVEQSETRVDAQVAREVEVALPRELTPEQMMATVRAFVSDQFTSLGMIADIAFHHLTDSNPHSHILLTMREKQGDGFGLKRRDWNDRSLLHQWRARWAHFANAALVEAGHAGRIDHRTLIEQAAEAEINGLHNDAIALDRQPTIHERGNPNARQHNDSVRQSNAERQSEWQAIEQAARNDVRSTPAPVDESPQSKEIEMAARDDVFVTAMRISTEAKALRWRRHENQVQEIDAWLLENAGGDTRRLVARDQTAFDLQLARAHRGAWLANHPKPFWPWLWLRWRKQRDVMQAMVEVAKQASARADRLASPEAIVAWRRDFVDQLTKRDEQLAARREIALTPNEHADGRRKRYEQRKAAERAEAKAWGRQTGQQPDAAVPRPRPPTRPS
jgi:hypothetical protein